jgi:peptidoglycan/LPS O-acetylase OafA/YrhL
VLYRRQSLLNLPQSVSWCLVVGSLLGIVAFHHYGVSAAFGNWFKGVIGEDWYRSLTFSKWFLADYLLAGLVFANFVGMRNVLGSGGKTLLAIQAPVRFFANYTFTLYLLHQPVFLFWAAVVRGDPQTMWYWTIVTVLTILTVGLVGHFTEQRRHLLRSWLLPVFRRWEVARTTATS